VLKPTIENREVRTCVRKSFFTCKLNTLALRQQLAVYKRKQPKPKIKLIDRLFWVSFRKLNNALF